MQIEKTEFSLIIPVFHNSKKGDDYSRLSPYFVERKLSSSSQLMGSPLLSENSPFIGCLELQQGQRKKLGIRNNEGNSYTLSKIGANFTIGKIKLWLFEGDVGFITVDIGTGALDSDKVLDLTSRLCNIKERTAIVYNEKIEKDKIEERRITIYDLLNGVLSMQNDLSLKPTSNTYNKAKLLFYGVSDDFEDNNDVLFLEMLRRQNKSNQRVPCEIENKNCYKPFEYITWATSENVVAAISDTKRCGADNENFITDRGGLVQSIFSNYLIVYLYYMSVNMRMIMLQEKYNLNDVSAITSCSDECIYELKNILNLPICNMTNEMHINELLDKYYCDEALGLLKKINMFSECEKLKSLEDINIRLENIEERIDSIEKQLASIVNFVEKDMKEWLVNKKSQIQKSMDEEMNEANISRFIEDSSLYINEEINKANDVVERETDELQKLFGEVWWRLTETSRNSLISASVLWRSCSCIDKKDFDFSGVCISATSALESELKRVFFDGFQRYMEKTYGKPDKNNWENTFEVWPERLLSSTRYDYERKVRDGKKPELSCQKIFTMGQVPYLMGKLENKFSVVKNALMIEKMNEYLKTIIRAEHFTEPIKLFYNSDLSCFVNECEKVRTSYRNPAAHADIIDKNRAEQCYMMVVGKREAEAYVSEIAGLIISLYKCLKEDVGIDNNGM